MTTTNKTPFSYVNAVNEAKDIEVTSEYSQYLMNRNFSMFNDTILIANHANSLQNIDNELHFKFYRNLVNRRKRYFRWPKTNSSDDINIISEYFQFSIEKALEALRILSDEQIMFIKKWHEGKNNDGQLKT